MSEVGSCSIPRSGFAFFYLPTMSSNLSNFCEAVLSTSLSLFRKTVVTATSIILRDKSGYEIPYTCIFVNFALKIRITVINLVVCVSAVRCARMGTNGTVRSRISIALFDCN